MGADADGRTFDADFGRERGMIRSGAPACSNTTARYGTDGLQPVVSRSLRPGVDTLDGAPCGVFGGQSPCAVAAARCGGLC